MRMIDADAIKGKAVPHTRGAYGYSADIRKWAVLVGDIDDAPTIDPESLRPKGRWIESLVLQTDISALYDYTCSECAIVCSRESNYCPNCGADMREG